MADIVKDENIVKNGFSSVLSSTDSVDVLIHPDSSETSAAEPQTASGYRSMKNSTTNSSLASSSEAGASDINFDFSTAVNSSESPASSDYSGTRFVVKRMQSSELQQLSSTSSCASSKTPSESPKSVKFVVEQESPVKSPRKSPKGKSPKKTSGGGLTKSITTDAMSKLLKYEPKELFSPLSQDSFPSKEEIELPTISKHRDETSDEDAVPDRSKVPLLTKRKALSDSETDLLNKTQVLSKIEVRGAGGIVTTLSVNELPTTPVSSHSEGTSTANADAACENCLMNSTVIYITFIIGIFLGAGIFLGLLYGFGYMGQDNLAAVNQTANDSATTLPIGMLNLGTEPFTTELPAATNEPTFTTLQETDTPMTTTNDTNIDDTIPFTETTTNTD